MAEQFDEEVDILILGFGASGAAAAVTAGRTNASVLIAEKQAEDAHTPNIKMSRGVLMSASDVDKATEYLTICAGGLLPDPVVRVLAERSSKLLGWVAEVCPDLPYSNMGKAEHPDFPGADAIASYQGGLSQIKRDPKSLSGRDLFAHLKRAVERTSTQIAWSSPAKRLIREEDQVVGAVLETPDGSRKIRARGGVLLTCGGFEYDELAKTNYLPASPIYFYGNPGNNGDGLRMAQSVGADLWHMNQLVGRAIGHFKLDSGVEMGFSLGIDAAAIGYEQGPAGYVIVDGEGRRFANEHVQALLTHDFFYALLEFDAKTGTHPRIPCYWIFDEARRLAGPLSMSAIGANAVGLYDWSSDNSKEIEKGWIVKGDTVAEVAAKLGVEDSEAAALTVQEFNAMCQNGQTDPLGRPAQTMVPLTKPPYYGVKLFPGGSHTTGGPRRNEKAEVINVFGEPIEGLYSAGELGQAIGKLYPADGFALCEALSFGQIAAESALKRLAASANGVR